VVLGIAAMNTQGVQGAVYQMLNHGVSTGGLFLIVGMLSDRRHTRQISEFGGLKKVTPRLVAAFLIVTLSSIGLPGLNGFVGEYLALIGTFLSLVIIYMANLLVMIALFCVAAPSPLQSLLDFSSEWLRYAVTAGDDIYRMMNGTIMRWAEEAALR